MQRVLICDDFFCEVFLIVHSMAMRAFSFFTELMTALSACVGVAESAEPEATEESYGEKGKEEVADVEVGGEHEE